MRLSSRVLGEQLGGIRFDQVNQKATVEEGLVVDLYPIEPLWPVWPHGLAPTFWREIDELLRHLRGPVPCVFRRGGSFWARKRL